MAIKDNRKRKWGGRGQGRDGNDCCSGQGDSIVKR